MKRQALIFTTAALSMLGVAAGGWAPAHATITFDLKNDPQPNEENILFGAKETGFLIQGATDTSNITVDFSSTDKLLQNSKGQAMILNDLGGNLTNIKVWAPGYVLRTLSST